MRVLIVGGYGVFGGRLTRLLATERRLTLIIAGRSPAKAQAFAAALKPGVALAATLEPARFDRDGDLAAQFAALKPDLVIDATGPFQGYSCDPYRLVRATIDHGASYMDLADGSDFVAGIAQFDAAATAKGVTVLSGVSSFPVLTAAVVRHLARDGMSVECITGGIAPSPYAGVGLNVIRAIASYAGKPVALTRDGQSAHGIGLVEAKRFVIAPPGRMPLRPTRFTLVDVPDLRATPPQWPGLKSIWMGAGPVPAVLHHGLSVLSRGVQWRLLPSLERASPLFHWAINHLRWGEHRGGMFVEIEGFAPDGRPAKRSWHLLAEGEDGPLIPSMAVEGLVRALVDGRRLAPGARAATSELELDDYARLFQGRTITFGVRGDSEPDMPLYRRVLGSAWSDLPPALQALHDIRGAREVRGLATVDRGTSLVSRVIARVFGFPAAGRNVPISVRFNVADGVETWTRTFAGKTFHSTQAEGTGRDAHLIVERFGPFAFSLAPVVEAGRLDLVVRRWSCLGVSMPLALAPGGTAFEVAVDGRFNFDVDIRLPGAGRIVRYRGELE